MDVNSPPFLDAIRGPHRPHPYGVYALQSGPRPTIEGVSSSDDLERPTWVLNVHRMGFVQVLSRLPERRMETANYEGPFLHDREFALFRAFRHLCEKCFDVGGVDVPYLFRLALVNSQNIPFEPGFERSDATILPIRKRELRWPDVARQVGEPLESVSDAWCQGLYHAFGQSWEVRPDEL